jgi:hypothetical protein
MCKRGRVHPWLPLALLLAAGPLCAGDFKRFELQPFGGLTASGRIPLIGDDDVRRGSVHVNSSSNIGATFAVYLNELDSVEALWQRQFTEGSLPVESAEALFPGGAPGFGLKIDQAHANFIHQYQLRDSKAMPFVMAGLGATTYRANRAGQSVSKSYFSFALGGGVKYYVMPHLGFRGEGRWSPTVLSGSDSDFWCSFGGFGASCRIRLKTSLQHQLHLTAGLILRF